MGMSDIMNRDEKAMVDQIITQLNKSMDERNDLSLHAY